MVGHPQGAGVMTQDKSQNQFIRCTAKAQEADYNLHTLFVGTGAALFERDCLRGPHLAKGGCYEGENKPAKEANGH